MALDGLLAALRRQAETERDAVLASSRAGAERVRAEAQGRLAVARGRALEAQREELRGALEVEVAVARRLARADVLAARQRFLDRVFGAAQAALPRAVASDAYRAHLPHQLARALECIGDDPVVIHCPESLASTVRGLVVGRPETTVRGDPGAAPGIRIVTADGAIEVDDTLGGRLERERSRLALGVIEGLSGTS